MACHNILLLVVLQEIPRIPREFSVGFLALSCMLVERLTVGLPLRVALPISPFIMARRQNYFASLEEEEPAAPFTFAPSVLAAAAPFASLSSSASVIISTAALHDDGSGGLPVSSSSSSFAPGSLSLASLAEDLLSTSKALPAQHAAWDFSGLTNTATEATVALAAEVKGMEDRQRVAEARLAVAETDRALLREKEERSSLSHAQRVRRRDQSSRGEDSSDKLSSKVAKREQAQKRRNKAKGAY